MVTGELKRGRMAKAVLGTQQVMMGAGGGEEEIKKLWGARVRSRDLGVMGLLITGNNTED